MSYAKMIASVERACIANLSFGTSYIDTLVDSYSEFVKIVERNGQFFDGFTFSLNSLSIHRLTKDVFPTPDAPQMISFFEDLAGLLPWSSVVATFVSSEGIKFGSSDLRIGMGASGISAVAGAFSISS
jgi:hypothetical protein